LLEKLRDEHVLTPFLEQGGTIEHDRDLHEPSEEVARQGQAANGGVLALGVVRVKAELGGSGRAQPTPSEYRLGKLGEGGVRTAPVDAAHLFAGGHDEAARLK